MSGQHCSLHTGVEQVPDDFCGFFFVPHDFFDEIPYLCINVVGGLFSAGSATNPSPLDRKIRVHPGKFQFN